MKKAQIFYYCVPNQPNRLAKLDHIRRLDFEQIPFERITPDDKGNWLNQTNRYEWIFDVNPDQLR